MVGTAIRGKPQVVSPVGTEAVPLGPDGWATTQAIAALANAFASTAVAAEQARALAAEAALDLGWINIETMFGAIPDGPIPTFALGTPSTAGSTINTAAIQAAADAAAGRTLYIPASAAGSFVSNGTIYIHADTNVIFGGPGARVVLADGSKLTGRESTSIDVAMFELATPSERRVVIGGHGRIFGTKNRQLGHSSGTAWTLRDITGTDVTTNGTSLNFGWNETISAGLFPTPPFPIRIGTPPAGLPTAAACEVMIVDTLDIPNRTGTIMAATRGFRETAAVAHAAGEAIKVEYTAVFLDMSTNSEANATGQLEDHIVQNMWIYQCSGNGIHTMGLGADGVGRMHHTIISKLLGHQCDGNLLRQQSADGIIEGVISSLSGRQGICILGANQHGHHNKSFNSGRLSTDLGIGLDVQGPRNSDLSFEGQDNDWAACRVANANNEITVVADSNGRATGFDGTGLIFDGAGNQCKNNTISLKSFTRGGAFIRQAHSLTIVNDGSNGVDDNTIRMNNRLLTKADISGDPLGSYISGDGLGGQQQIAYAATIVPHPDLGRTIIVGTLTGNLTVGIPTNKSLDPSITLAGGVAGFGPCYRGQEFWLLITQDGTGGRTVTLNAAFSVTNASWLDTTAGAKSVFHAVCTNAAGTTWVQIP